MPFRSICPFSASARFVAHDPSSIALVVQTNVTARIQDDDVGKVLFRASWHLTDARIHAEIKDTHGQSMTGYRGRGPDGGIGHGHCPATSYHTTSDLSSQFHAWEGHVMAADDLGWSLPRFDDSDVGWEKPTNDGAGSGERPQSSTVCASPLNPFPLGPPPRSGTRLREAGGSHGTALPGESPADSLQDDPLTEYRPPQPLPTNSLSAVAITRNELLKDAFPDPGRRWLQLGLTAVFSMVLLGGVYVYRFRLSGPSTGLGAAPAAAAMVQAPLALPPMYAARKPAPIRDPGPIQLQPRNLASVLALAPPTPEPSVAPVASEISPRPTPVELGPTGFASTRRSDQGPLADAPATATPRDEPPALQSPLPPFSLSEAVGALGSAARAASSCLPPEERGTSVRVAVVFAPSGQATSASVEGLPYSDTSAGECIGRYLRSTRINPFAGTTVVVRKTFQVK